MNIFFKIFSGWSKSSYSVPCKYYSQKQCDEKIIRASVKEIRKFVKRVMLKANYTEESADDLATVLSMADYRGVQYLGLHALDKYFCDAKKGVCDGQAKPHIIQETCTTVYFNGNNAPGPTVANCAMAAAIKKAKCVGLGITSAKNCNSFGMGAKYVIDAIKENCIGFALGNSFPTVMPFGTNQVAVGSNAISVGCPADCDSFVLNMFSTNVPVHKIELYSKKCMKIPDQWALNSKGEPEHDPEVILKHPIMVPLGGSYSQQGYKGYGLCMALEMLTGVLAGGAVGLDHKPYGSTAGAPNLSMTMFAIDPTFFAPGFHERLAHMLNFLRNMEPIDPNSPVQIAGDQERKHMKEVDETGGVSYHESQIHGFNQVAASAGVEPLVTLNTTK